MTCARCSAETDGVLYCKSCGRIVAAMAHKWAQDELERAGPGYVPVVPRAVLWYAIGMAVLCLGLVFLVWRWLR